MARKAWTDLAESTRRRYGRAAKRMGLPESDGKLVYNSKAIPSHAIYGKKPSRQRMAENWTPTPRQTASIERLAQRAGIKSSQVDDILGRAIDAGASYGDIERILKERAFIRNLPKKRRKALGRTWYDERPIHYPVELFWY